MFSILGIQVTVLQVPNATVVIALFGPNTNESALNPKILEKVKKSGHHLFHDRESEGNGFIPGLMS